MQKQMLEDEDFTQYQTKIRSLLQEYRQLVFPLQLEPLFDRNRIKWKQLCQEKDKKAKNYFLQFKQEIDEGSFSSKSAAKAKLKQFQKQHKQIREEYEVKLKAPIKINTVKKTISQLNSPSRDNHLSEKEPNIQQNNNVQSLIERGNKQIFRMRQAITTMNVSLQEGMELSEAINIELNRQIEQLDLIQDKVKDTGSTLKRANKTISFFAKAAQCDKCVAGLVISIILALITFIVLILKKN